MPYHEHHFRNLERARDHLTETIVSLQSAVDRMTGDDWIDAAALLNDLTEDVGPRLARLRTAASGRFDDYTRLQGFEAMRTGSLPFPDERLPITPDTVRLTPDASVEVARLDAPNARAGAALVAQHGGLEEAMKAYAPDSPEFDHIQAYRYVTSGKRPKGWLPPIV